MRGLLLATLILSGTTGLATAQTPAPEGRPDGSPPWGAPGGGFRGPVFVSPVGEPFHSRPGEGPPQDQWFARADANHDGVLTVEEMEADAARFFLVLDRQHDGEIDPEDIEYYETVLAPEIRVRGTPGGGGPRGGVDGGMGGGGMGGGGMGGGGRDGGGRDGGGHHGDGEGPPSGGGPTRSFAGKQGAARFGYLDFPEPVTSADSNMNRGVDPAEFRTAADARFALLDANHDGKLEKGELPHLDLRGQGGRHDRPGGGRQDIPPPPHDGD